MQQQTPHGAQGRHHGKVITTERGTSHTGILHVKNVYKSNQSFQSRFCNVFISSSALFSSGLYTSGRDSPMSTRSDKMMFPKHSRHSGSESENGTRRGHGERKRESDNESEASVRRHRRRR